MASFKIRDYAPEDYDAVLPLWQKGFAEMAPDSYKTLTSSPAALIIAASVGSALALTGFSKTGFCVAAFGAMIYTPAGFWLLNTMMWQGVRRQTRDSMQPHHLTDMWMTAGRSHFWVAQDLSGAILGCVGIKKQHTLHKERRSGVEWVDGEASVWRLTVAPSARGSGVGRALMQSAEEWACQNGAKRMTLICGNKVSQLVYGRLGYTPEAEEKARRVLFGPSGVPPGWFGWLQLRMLNWRLNDRKTVLGKSVAYVTSGTSPVAKRR